MSEEEKAIVLDALDRAKRIIDLLAGPQNGQHWEKIMQWEYAEEEARKVAA
jgi:hypothetical protein